MWLGTKPNFLKAIFLPTNIYVQKFCANKMDQKPTKKLKNDAKNCSKLRIFALNSPNIAQSLNRTASDRTGMVACLQLSETLNKTILSAFLPIIPDIPFHFIFFPQTWQYQLDLCGVFRKIVLSNIAWKISTWKLCIYQQKNNSDKKIKLVLS